MKPAVTQDNSPLTAPAGIGHNSENLTIAEIKELPGETIYFDIGVEKILEIAAKENDFSSDDVETEAGRKEIASKAYAVALLKSPFEQAGLKLTEGWRLKTKEVNDKKKALLTGLDALRDKIRAPLDAYEAQEKTRKDNHRTIFAEIQGLANFPIDMKVADVDARIEALTKYDDHDWEEFAEHGKPEYERVFSLLTQKRVAVEKAEADAAELEELRKQREKDQQAERQEESRKSEHRLRMSRMTGLSSRAESLSSLAIRDRMVEVQNYFEGYEGQPYDWEEFKPEAELAYKATNEALNNALTIANQREDDERKRRDDEVAQRERDRIAKEQADQKAEQEKRESNKRHRNKIHDAAIDAMAASIQADAMDSLDKKLIAKDILNAIADGKIPNVTVIY